MVIEYLSINHLDLTEQVYRFLKERILRRDIKPGEKISVEDVARGLKVSRTPVVNALQMLKNDGLVDIVPRRGTFVTELTARDVADLFDVRLLLELHAADMVFKKGRTAELLAEFDVLLAQMKEAISEEEYMDYESFIDKDRNLHQALIKYLDNQRLINIYSELNVHMQVARAHYLATVENALEAHKEHEALLSALREKDQAAFKKAITDHIENVNRRIQMLLEERGGKL